MFLGMTCAITKTQVKLIFTSTTFSQHERSENFSLRRSYPSASSLVLSLVPPLQCCQSCASIFFAIPSCPTKAVLHVRTQASTPQSIWVCSYHFYVSTPLFES